MMKEDGIPYSGWKAHWNVGRQLPNSARSVLGFVYKPKGMVGFMAVVRYHADMGWVFEESGKKAHVYRWCDLPLDPDEEE